MVFHSVYTTGCTTVTAVRGKSRTWTGMRERHLNWRGQRSRHRSADIRCANIPSAGLLAQCGLGKLRLLPPLWGSTTTGGVPGCWSPTHARRPPIFWGPVSLFLQVGEGHLSLVLAPCCCVIILFPSALSLDKMMLLQSHTLCVCKEQRPRCLGKAHLS